MLLKNFERYAWRKLQRNDITKFVWVLSNWSNILKSLKISISTFISIFFCFPYYYVVRESRRLYYFWDNRNQWKLKNLFCCSLIELWKFFLNQNLIITLIQWICTSNYLIESNSITLIEWIHFNNNQSVMGLYLILVSPPFRHKIWPAYFNTAISNGHFTVTLNAKDCLETYNYNQINCCAFSCFRRGL